ncbi:MAG: hypothetical protein N4A48_12300 [Tepidibacter sp.]|jgi:hypothetical protein|uniref:hypothetical protein n=1 Tax=Tepidibacter sp. TaxID=2529387 RepID=UPI0025FA0F6F|nr:hypothetical protein [Tepidibacter sp.]MCT4509511.1 hypothetical protein [Tepidibacter sp.]
MTKIYNNYNNSKKYNLISKKNDLDLCKRKIRNLKNISLDNLSIYEKNKITRDLEIELRRKEVLERDLKKLGFIETKGRPKKNPDEKYCNTRKKFTAMLLPKNLDYLKALKSEQKIDNISSFLDEIIEIHRIENSNA